MISDPVCKTNVMFPFPPFSAVAFPPLSKPGPESRPLVADDLSTELIFDGRGKTRTRRIREHAFCPEAAGMNGPAVGETVVIALHIHGGAVVAGGLQGARIGDDAVRAENRSRARIAAARCHRAVVDDAVVGLSCIGLAPGRCHAVGERPRGGDRTGVGKRIAAAVCAHAVVVSADRRDDAQQAIGQPVVVVGAEHCCAAISARATAAAE
ncbi:MAG: hypothetical protein WBF99_14800 [Xanthobacteraceae bacterium]